jgi:signal transduction histidine kinase
VSRSAGRPSQDAGTGVAPAALSPAASDPGAPSHWPDSHLLDEAIVRTLSRPTRAPRWLGWRRRMVVWLAIFGVLSVALAARLITMQPRLPGEWRPDAGRQALLVATNHPLLLPHVGQRLMAVLDRKGDMLPPAALDLSTSLRWTPLAEDRQRRAEAQVDWFRAVQEASHQGELTLIFASGEAVRIHPTEGNIAALPVSFWFLMVLALALFVAGLFVPVSRLSIGNLFYSLATLAQVGELALWAAESAFTLGTPQALAVTALPWRMGLSLVTVFGLMSVAVVFPRRLPGAPLWLALAWLVAAALLWLVLTERSSNPWGLVHASASVCGMVGAGFYAWSYRLQRNPLASMLWRFAAMLAISLMLLGLLAVESALHAPQYARWVGVVILMWEVFFSTLLLVVPLLSQAQILVREFAMLAIATTLAVVLDPLLVGALGIDSRVAVLLSLGLTLAFYLLMRRVLLRHEQGTHLATAERLFERLYRVVREIEQNPEQTAAQLSLLLRDLFQPLELTTTRLATGRVRQLMDGSTLIVPVPRLVDDRDRQGADPTRSIVMRFARHGQRLFTRDDARLVERVLEQLQRAVAFDQAVEQGRSEERVRIAQDLHDDIGARLLTLMYKSTDPEMEDYVRHTLQDLKTLTRGLAARQPRLSDAMGEWKADIAQRLSLAGCELGWETQIDDDLRLSVVQWSGLTRVLRELISNTIAHAQATRVDVQFQLRQGTLMLVVADNGIGTDPAAWSRGLGVGGIRKRVRQLDGNVAWRSNLERGIRCEVRLPLKPAQPALSPA